jgi:NAD+ synthase
MDRIPDYLELKLNIVEWIDEYVNKNPVEALVVGVSGGIDSAVVSTLCAETGLPTYAVGMPIHQDEEQESLSDSHLEWLTNKYTNVTKVKFDLTNVFETFKKDLGSYGSGNHSLANTRSRLRMVTLYQVAGNNNGLVVGTGNKVEDYGIGFYTKYGDGGVDIAPIADLYKTEVWELGKHLGVDERIIIAQPTDGLWDDGRCDEYQIGASYADLEHAMEYGNGPAVRILHDFNTKNKHKMTPIPTFKLL